MRAKLVALSVLKLLPSVSDFRLVQPSNIETKPSVPTFSVCMPVRVSDVRPMQPLNMLDTLDRYVLLVFITVKLVSAVQPLNMPDMFATLLALRLARFAVLSAVYPLKALANDPLVGMLMVPPCTTTSVMDDLYEFHGAAVALAMLAPVPLLEPLSNGDSVSTPFCTSQAALVPQMRFHCAL